MTSNNPIKISPLMVAPLFYPTSYISSSSLAPSLFFSPIRSPSSLPPTSYVCSFPPSFSSFTPVHLSSLPPTFSCYLFPSTEATVVINCTKEDYDRIYSHRKWSKDQTIVLTVGDVITDIKLVCNQSVYIFIQLVLILLLKLNICIISKTSSVILRTFQ